MNKISKRCIAAFISVVMLCSLVITPGMASSAAETTNLTAFEQAFLSPDNDAKPFIRWWIAPGRMNEEETRREIKSFADGGFGGVELQSLELAKGCKINDPVWNETMKWILKAGRDYGIQIDFTIGQMWPIATPAITDADDDRAQQVIRMGNVDFTATETNRVYTRSGYFFPSQLAQARAWELIAITAAKRVSGSGTNSTYDSATAVNLLDANQDTIFNPDTGEIAWTAPSEGNWAIFYSYRQSNGTMLGYGINQYTIDHMSKEATKAVTDHWDAAMDSDPELKALYEANGGSIFGDSFELSSNLWTKNMLAEFEARRGYDLTPYLPAISNTFNDIGGRIRNDLYTTMTELLTENHMNEFRTWAHGHNMTLRYQAYSSAGTSNFELTRPASATDIVEVESYAMSGTIPDAYRQLSGVVSMRGDKIFSSETGEIGQDSWRGTWTDTQRRDGSSSRHLGFMYYANRQFAVGVNKMILHGATYKFTDNTNMPMAPGANWAWPGYSAMAALSYGNEWDEKTPMWENADIMTDVLSRTQMVLQQGQSDVDLAVYRFMFGKGNVQSNITAVEQAGYTYDYVSQAILDMKNAVVGTQNGKPVLAANGPSYKALVLEPAGNNANEIPLEVAKKIVDYAKAGLPVVIVGNIPTRAAYYPGNNDDVDDTDAALAADAQLAKYMSELASLESVRMAANRAELAAALAELGVTPDAKSSNSSASSIYFSHRNTADTEFYFIYNDAAAASGAQTLTLKGTGAPYLLDPWSGEITPIVKYTTGNGAVTIDIDLASRDTMMIAIAQEGWSSKTLKNSVAQTTADSAVYDEKTSGLALRTTQGGNLNVILDDGKSVSLTAKAAQAPINLTNWTMVLNRWTEGATIHDTVIVPSNPYDLSTTGLIPWYEIDPANLTRVAGVARYTTSFELEKGWEEGQGAYLDFTRVSDAARLFVNGSEVSMNQISNSVDIGKYLVAGTNTIVAEVSSNMSNVKYGTAANNTWAFGIIGAVTLTPYIQVAVVPASFKLASPSVTEYEANTPFGVIVTTSADAAKVKIVNESGNSIGKIDEVITKNADGTKTYRITLMIGTPGEKRTLSAMVMGEIGDYKNVGASLNVKIVPAAPVQNLEDMISAASVPTAGVNTPFTVTVKTSTAVNKVKIVGETGSTIGTLESSKVDADGVRTWTISIKVGSKGSRTLTVLGAAASGGYGTEGKSFHINIG